MNEGLAREILGLPSSANFRAAKAAYRNLVRIHHPDRAGSDPAAQRRASETMSRINAAWEYLEKREKSGVFGSADSAASNNYSSQVWIKVRARKPDECELCGSYPARRIDVRGLQQIIIRYALIGYKGVLCKSCAQSAGREALRTTLLQGWWGLFWFINYYFVISLLIKLFVIGRMKSPVFRDIRVMAPFDIPLFPGKNPLRQPAPLVFLIGASLLLVSSIFSNGSSTSSTSSSSNPSSSSSSATPDLRCWTEQESSGLVRGVDCSSPSAYFIEIAQVYDAERCPTLSWGTIKDDDSELLYCVGLKP
jgi:hypothetical protein